MANSPAIVLTHKQTGQVLAFFALVIPVALLPVVAYAVDATIVAGREAGLQEATAVAAETAAQQLDVGSIRSAGTLALDGTQVDKVVVQVLVGEEPAALVDSYQVTGADVTVITSERVELPFSMFMSGVTLHAHATARLVAGYDTPKPAQMAQPSS